MRRGAGAGFLAMLLLAQLCLAGDCVDGVTPDCSDPAARCGPNLDGSSPPSDAPAETSNDAAPDTAPDAAPDTGDQ